MRLFTSPYIRLMRLHQPVGIWLLLWPCWWSLALAAHGAPSIWLMLLFALGAVVMRSAGCIVNDIADRTFDRKVERTRMRPLASGELQVKQAVTLLVVLLLIALGIALAMGENVVFWAFLSLPLVAAYPFMKRISWWPQLFLGFTFNWGALMGWVAVRENIELPAVLLYIGGVFWTLGYDTIYAHQDKKDDLRAGVKSTALKLGKNTLPAVYIFYGLALLLWAMGAWISGYGTTFFFAWFLTAAHFMWQLRRVELDDAYSCRQVFVSNIWLGGLVFLGLLMTS